MLQKILFISIMAFYFAVVPAAQAHRPEQPSQESVTLITSASTSYAYYREITSPGEVHIYKFSGEPGETFHAGINIPQIDGLENFGVSFALIGPGLDLLDSDSLPYSVSETHIHENNLSHFHLDTITAPAYVQEIFVGTNSGSAGAVILENQVTEDFYEPFTQTNYWGRQSLDIEIPTNETYYLMVWTPDSSIGKYVLDTGLKEVFGPGDLFRFPLWWINTRVYFEQTTQLLLNSSFVVLAIIGLIIFVRRKKSTKTQLT